MCCRHEFGAVSEEAAGRNKILDAHTGTDKVHLDEIAAALTQLFNDRTDIFLRYVQSHALHRLALLTIDLLVEHARVGAAKLVALAAHGLDEYRKMHFTASGYTEVISRIAVADAQRHVLEQLAVEAVTYLS